MGPAPSVGPRGWGAVRTQHAGLHLVPLEKQLFPGLFQLSHQAALTAQLAASKAKADQNLVNANTPVNIAGGDVYGGSNTANQTGNNTAGSSADNSASTSQDNNQSQTAGPSGCYIGCGGNGQAQLSSQDAATLQAALSKANANQNLVNANVPVNIAGYDIYGGSNAANQTGNNSAGSSSSNGAGTSQGGDQSQST